MKDDFSMQVWTFLLNPSKKHFWGIGFLPPPNGVGFASITSLCRSEHFMLFFTRNFLNLMLPKEMVGLDACIYKYDLKAKVRVRKY